jgi:predicted MFS family arabinose efflux permease
VGGVYMLGGSGYFAGSLFAGGPLRGVSARHLLVSGTIAMSLCMAVAYSQVFGTPGSVAVLPAATFAGAVGWVGLAALLTAESPAAAGTTMALNGSLFNLGAAGGGAAGGALLALGGYSALAVGLPLCGAAAAMLASIRSGR